MPMPPVLNPSMAKIPPGFFALSMGIMVPMGGLIAHLIWGTVLGGVYGAAGATRQQTIQGEQRRLA
jgi:hypothetical protein